MRSRVAGLRRDFFKADLRRRRARLSSDAPVAAASRRARGRGGGAELIELNVSAYAPRLQRILHTFGFRPAAYAPAMVFRGTERLDVVKMVRLNVAYAPGEMALTEAARMMRSLVEHEFVGASARVS